METRQKKPKKISNNKRAKPHLQALLDVIVLLFLIFHISLCQVVDSSLHSKNLQIVNAPSGTK